MTAIILPPGLYNKLGLIAAEQRVSLQFIVEQACWDYVRWTNEKRRAEGRP